MSCKAELKSTVIPYGKKSCVICRDDGKTEKDVIYKAGEYYAKCSPVVADPEGGDCVVVPMTDKNQEIIGVVMCATDLRAEGSENCPAAVLRCAQFDMNCMCWPEGFTVDDLKMIAFNHDKPCFTTREGCAILPERLQTASKKVTK